MRWRVLFGLGVLVMATSMSGCGTAPSASRKTTTTTPSGAPSAPTPFPDTYTDAPRGEPGYALVVVPGADGSGIMGGVAVYQYQDGEEAAYFSFYGRATSSAPFTLTLKGDRSATTATAQVTETPNPSITLDDCSALLTPVVGGPAFGETEPAAASSCVFTYKLAPGGPRSVAGAATNMTADAATKSDLLTAYLDVHEWQSQYASDIALHPGATYLAYDPDTGLDWAVASFDYNGPADDAAGSPPVAMQDGGNTGIFYQVPPVAGSLPSYDGWVMVGSLGVPACYSKTVIPSAVLSVWGLRDNPYCASEG